MYNGGKIYQNLFQASITKIKKQKRYMSKAGNYNLAQIEDVQNLKMEQKIIFYRLLSEIHVLINALIFYTSVCGVHSSN